MNPPLYNDSDAVRIAGTLPELLRFRDGAPVACAADWPRRRREVQDAIIQGEYGGMPPALAPDATSAEAVHVCHNNAERRFPGSTKVSVLAEVAGGAEPFRFEFTIHIPAGEGPFPVIANGDGCWGYLTDEIIGDVLAHGFALVHFNRCVFARDRDGARDLGIYRAFPGGYGALSAWAWAYHRVLDALHALALPELDLSRYAVTGHSRGGKTVQLAAATDGRIAAVVDNNSGCGGFSSSRVLGPGAETIADITRNFPFWFSKEFASYAGREGELPYDQHFLAALIAPRPLRFQIAYGGDDWSNPVGACATYRAAMEVYRLLGAEGNFSIAFRDGKHGHTPMDWKLSLDFLKQTLSAATAARCGRRTLATGKKR